MAYTAFTDDQVAVGKPWNAEKAQQMKANLDWLYGQLNNLQMGIGIVNGSFEVDSDLDGDPDAWTVNNYAGGSHALSTVAVAHGLKSLAFVHPGGASNGGGYAWSDYVTVNAAVPITVSWSYYTTNGSMKVIVQVRWYDKDQAYLSTTNIMSSTTNGTAWQRVSSDPLYPVANAVYAKVEIVGGYTDTNQAGTCYFDDVQVHQARTVIPFGSGVNGVSGVSTSYYNVHGYQLSALDGYYLTRGGMVNGFYVACSETSYTTITLRKNGSDTALTKGPSANGWVAASSPITFAFGDRISFKVGITQSVSAELSWCIPFHANLE